MGVGASWAVGVGVVVVALSAPLAATTQPAEDVARVELPSGPDVVAIHAWAAESAPCVLDADVLVGISKAVSNHADIEGFEFDSAGTLRPPLLGEIQDGGRGGLAKIVDTDAGTLDGDAEWDRPVGPMQFLPESWAQFGLDGNADGLADPHNIWDASAAAAAMLCDSGTRAEAIRRYTGSDELAERAQNAIDVVVAERVEDKSARRGPDGIVVVEQRTPRRNALESHAAEAEPPSGDWDGDGRPGSAEWIMLEDETLALQRIDDAGFLWAAPLVIDPDSTPLVGDWDGDGYDTVALWDVTEDASVRYLDAAGTVVSTETGLPADSTVSAASEHVVRLFREEGFDLRGPEVVVASASIEPADIIIAANGTIVVLVDVAGIRVSTEIGEQVAAMVEAAAEDGVELTGWGWRSHQRQIELREAHCEDPVSTPPADCTPPTAYPGQSRHELGLAIDFHVEQKAIGRGSPQFAWLAENAEDYGLFNLESEPWHWSVDGR